MIVLARQQPYDDWMKQVARNLTDPVNGFLIGTKYLIHDRDSLFSRGFRNILKDSQVETIKLPEQSPNLNAFAERGIRDVGKATKVQVFELLPKK